MFATVWTYPKLSSTLGGVRDDCSRILFISLGVIEIDGDNVVDCCDGIFVVEVIEVPEVEVVVELEEPNSSCSSSIEGFSNSVKVLYTIQVL